MATSGIEAGVWVNQNHPSPPKKAPPTEVGVLGWLKSNLFSGIGNTVLTLVSAVLLYYIIYGVLRWAIVDATWTPTWLNRKLFVVGTYPQEFLWQPALILMYISLLFGLSAGQWGSIIRSVAIGLAGLLLLFIVVPVGDMARIYLAISLALLIGGYVLALRRPIPGNILALGWFISIPLSLMLLKGGVEIRSLNWQLLWLDNPVRPSDYGGLLLTVLLTVVGIAFSFPIGVLLALGRRSNLPVIKWFSIAYIEIIRGVPLITLLFMAMIVLPLFLPQGMPSPANVTRVMVGVTMFASAYLAENVRGGLQSVSKGQWEAADALGLNNYQKLRMIILPQALRAVIPAIVGQFIGLFKDTSLVALVGLADLLGIARAVIQQPDWLEVAGGVNMEVYVYISVIYFVFSYGMSWASRQLEAQLGVGQR